jgi:cytochrome P450/NADPH-cytochrome P450 reductase
MPAANPLHPIPHPPKKPLIGNVLTLDGETPMQGLMQLTREHGPIYWLDMLGTPIVVVSGAALVDELCDEKRFDKAVRGSLRRVRAIGGDGLFTGDTQEPNWSKAHNILLPTFSQRAMVNYLPMMLDIASQLMLKWERLNADDEIDVVHDMTALALDTIGLCGFDYRFNSFYRQDYHPFIEALTRVLETSMRQRGLPMENLMLRKRLGQLKNDVEFMNGMVDDVVRERRRSGDKTKNDLLNYMLTGVDKTTGEQLDDVNIRYQINTFLIAGHETTSGLLSFAIYFLLNHPDVLAKAYEEVDRVLGTDPSVMPTFQQVNQLQYVSQILKESLRLYPTAPAFGLYPYENETIGGQYKLKKRTFITVLALMLHRDKSVWGENADEFNPDNFTREAEASRPVNAYKPFGNGQRACIGRQFAMQEAQLALGMILQRFQLFDHQKYQLKIKETLSIKPDGFKIRVRPRSGRTRSALVPGIAIPAAATTGPAAAARTRPSHGTPLTVLYGSNLGTTEDFARTIAESADLNGFETRLATLDERVGDLPKEGAVVIACASYNGGAPDNAVRFTKWLEEATPGALNGVRYAVFGCGNRDWASTYQSVPRMIDDRMASLGATRITTRAEADAREDLDGQFQAWLDPLWPSLAKSLDLDIDFSAAAKAEPLFSVDVVPEPQSGVAAAAGARPMRVLVNRELQQRNGAANRSTRHIEVELPEGGSYRPGDHLSVVASNSERMVTRALKHFGFDAGTHVRLTAGEGRRTALPVGEPIALKRLLSDFVELQDVATRKQIETLAAHTRCPRTKPVLEALANDAERYRAEVWLKRKSVLDLLEEHPACELPFNEFLEMLPAMAPRYYSISSSPRAAKDRCSITVAVVEGDARSGNGKYEGVCSSFLSRIGEGGTVHAGIRETKAGFRLPDDPQKPVIMVGPGTGLAPFRGFLQERAALKAAGATLGPALLFFGCRHPDQDFIYAGELQDFAAQGLTELHVAFSRRDGKKTYVQDLLREQAGKIWELLAKGATIYVCGDGSRMEPDVKRELVRIYREQTDADPAAAEAWIEQLSKQDRYVLDVWAGS